EEGQLMPRFVILEHDHPERHWDFMLEAGPVLRTWRLAKAPDATGIRIAAQPLGDHRALYLDYEGPLSGARGTVTRWDGATTNHCRPARDTLFTCGWKATASVERR